MTTDKELRDRSQRMASSARAFLAVDERIRCGELRPWGRTYKRVLKQLRDALEENYGASS